MRDAVVQANAVGRDVGSRRPFRQSGCRAATKRGGVPVPLGGRNTNWSNQEIRLPQGCVKRSAAKADYPFRRLGPFRSYADSTFRQGESPKMISIRSGIAPVALVALLATSACVQDRTVEVEVA